MSGQRRSPGARWRSCAAWSTGATNAEIGGRLGISEHTVRNHVHSVTRKLGVANRTDAVASGLRRGLVDLPE